VDHAIHNTPVELDSSDPNRGECRQRPVLIDFRSTEHLTRLYAYPDAVGLVPCKLVSIDQRPELGNSII
jgi:hypothetical protein